MDIPIYFNHEWLPELEQKITEDGPWDSFDLFQLALEAERNLMISDFDCLACLKYLPDLKPLPHQLVTVQKALTQMQGKAILADEVGLGKTIEAGLILKEYLVRGLVKKALILVPSSLVSQWTQELNQKFHIPAIAQKKEYMWKECDILVASIDTAKRSPHREIVLAEEYDMLIIDEAHKLKNNKSKNYEFATQLQKKYCLLLTATPIQNEIQEIFNLVSLLKPGLLGDLQKFQASFVQGKRAAKNSAKLQALLKKVMIRHLRKDGGLHFTKRHIHNIHIHLSEAERKVYDAVTQFIQQIYQDNQGASSAFSLITLQREVCSSKEATLNTLANLLQKNKTNLNIAQEIRKISTLINKIENHSKAKKMLEIVQDINSKVIIFTEYRATQDFLQNYLAEHHISSVPFRGGFKRSKKEWMIELFQHRAQVLIATEAGGEGINLQFCQHVINYDLPWNPMRVEQRIGRVHRLGQTKDVHIYNLTTKGTIEEYILHLLYEKINLFEMVIGELEQIIERLRLTSSIEESLADIFFHSSSLKEIEIKLDNFTKYIQTLKGTIQQTEQKERNLL